MAVEGAHVRLLPKRIGGITLEDPGKRTVSVGVFSLTRLEYN